MNLAGVAAFVLTGLYSAGSVQQGAMEVLLWVAWLVPASAAAALNRGAMAAAATAGVAALFVRSSSRWIRVAMVGLLIFVSASLLNPQVDIGSNRQLSFQQLVSNAVSLFGGEGGALNDATKAWREAWWAKIIGYTVDGPDFWTGKGYGINLADADGFQVTSDDSLRAPHSVHFEILARSGVPGLVLWLAVLAAWIVMMLRAAIRAARSRRRFLLALIGWVVAYWLASLVNGSVDVYIGGPQGGSCSGRCSASASCWPVSPGIPDALGDAEMPAPAPRPTSPMVASPVERAGGGPSRGGSPQARSSAKRREGEAGIGRAESGATAAAARGTGGRPTGGPSAASTGGPGRAPRMHVEGRPHPQHHGRFQAALVRRHPPFLLGCPKAHPHDVRPGLVDAVNSRLVLLVGWERPIRRCLAPHDGEAREAGHQSRGEALRHARPGAVEVAPPAVGRARGTARA